MKTYKKGAVTPSLILFLEQIQSLGYEFLTQIIVQTKKKEVELICEELKCALPCEIGKNGFTDFSSSFEEDGKTPLCETKVRHIDLPVHDINNPEAATISKTIEPHVNFGPCFVCFYINDPKTNKIRGIGLHGSEDDSDGKILSTDGCIRLFNADLFAIRKLFYKNLKILIT